MYYVYILESIDDPSRRSIASTGNLAQALSQNASGSWRLRHFVSFRDRERAEEFEHFLLTAEGIVFAERFF